MSGRGFPDSPRHSDGGTGRSWPASRWWGAKLFLAGLSIDNSCGEKISHHRNFFIKYFFLRSLKKNLRQKKFSSQRFEKINFFSSETWKFIFIRRNYFFFHSTFKKKISVIDFYFLTILTAMNFVIIYRFDKNQFCMFR